MDAEYSARLDSWDRIGEWTKEFWNAQCNPEQLEYLLLTAPPMDGVPADVANPAHGRLFMPMVRHVCESRSGAVGPRIVKLLIQYGSKYVNRVSTGGLSPLHAASSSGNEECVRCLVDAGADYMVLDSEGYLPFHAAVFSGSISLVQYWLQLIPDVMSYPFPTHPTVFHWLCEGMENGQQMMQFLVECSGIPTTTWVNIPLDDGSTPLITASKYSGRSMVRLLLEYGADADVWVSAQPNMRDYPVSILNLIISCSSTVVTGLSEDTRASLRAEVYFTPLLSRLI